MKYSKFLFIALSVMFIMQSCEKEESKTTANTATEVVIVLEDINNNNKPKEGYYVMMFNKPFDINNAKSIKSVKTGKDGMATFNLEDLVTDKKTFYFEAFKKQGNTYVQKSLARTKVEVSKHQSIKTNIPVE